MPAAEGRAWGNGSPASLTGRAAVVGARGEATVATAGERQQWMPHSGDERQAREADGGRLL